MVKKVGLFTIGDLHLSLGTDKPMDIFQGWDNYIEKLYNNWNNIINEKDTVVIVGDVSWGMSFKEIYNDFSFINNKLNGKKIIIKGNHDYWWNTSNKMNNYLEEQGFNNINILSNNAFLVDGISICGTRGWINETGDEFDAKILNREAGRLEMSFKDGIKKGGDLIAFIHYPPILQYEENQYITKVIENYKIKHCYYAHLHGQGFKKAFIGQKYNCNFSLVSADFLGFCPLEVIHSKEL